MKDNYISTLVFMLMDIKFPADQYGGTWSLSFEEAKLIYERFIEPLEDKVCSLESELIEEYPAD